MRWIGFGPDSRILTANLTWVPLSQVVVGDAVIGVTHQGRYLTYSKTKVEDMSKQTAETMQVNNKITVATEQRFLVQSKARNSKWQFVQSIDGKYVKCLLLHSIDHKTPSWCRGYLAGVIDGDGNWHYVDGRLRFKIAVKDEAILHQCKRCAETIRWPVHDAIHKTSAGFLKALVCEQTVLNEQMWDTIYKDDGTLEYAAGYLAGIFDAEGTASTPNEVRIAQRIGSEKSVKDNEEIIHKTMMFAERLNFCVDVWTNSNGFVTIRILNPLRFIVETQPVSRKRMGFLSSTIRTVKSYTLVTVKPNGIADVIALKTEAGSYVVEGFVVKGSSPVLQNFNKERK